MRIAPKQDFFPHADREPVSCSVCGAQPPAQVEFTVEGFSLVRCPACKVLRVSPRLKPAALQAYYDAGYWKSSDSVLRGYFDYPGDEANIRRTFRRRIKRIQALAGSQGRWLDVGCAFGFLLSEAQQAGWETGGVEWSEAAVSQAPAEIRGRIRSGSLQEQELDEASWDVISLWDYLEHSPDPRADLEKAASLLKPGGWLSVIIPDSGSWLARWMGPRWEEFKKPQEHLYFFTGQQLAGLCSSLGLAPRAREWAGKYAGLEFALSRFKPGDGVLFPIARSARFVLKVLGGSQTVMYINPHDKLHLLCQKEKA